MAGWLVCTNSGSFHGKKIEGEELKHVKLFFGRKQVTYKGLRQPKVQSKQFWGSGAGRRHLRRLLDKGEED